MVTPEPLSPGEDSPFEFEQDEDAITIPPELDDGLEGEEGKSKKDSAYFFGVLAGIAIWIVAVLVGTMTYCCCLKKPNTNLDSQVSERETDSSSNYRNLPGQRE